MEFKTDTDQLMKEYIKSLKDEDFKKLVVRLGVNEKCAMKYTSKLERTACELKDCSKCSGLHECKHELPGTIYYPKLEKDNTLRFNYVACKYKQKAEKEKELTSKTFEVPVSIQNAKMSEIDLGDKKRAKVLKWIKDFYKEYKTNKNAKECY